MLPTMSCAFTYTQLQQLLTDRPVLKASQVTSNLLQSVVHPKVPSHFFLGRSVKICDTECSRQPQAVSLSSYVTGCSCHEMAQTACFFCHNQQQHDVGQRLPGCGQILQAGPGLPR